MALVEFAAWCCASENSQPGTVSGKLAAVKYFHVVEAGVDLPTDSPLIKRLLQGMKRAFLLAGAPKRLPVPVALDVLFSHGSSAARQWGRRGRVMYLCLLLTYFVGARAHELFQNDAGEVHLAHRLTRGGVAFFEGP